MVKAIRSAVVNARDNPPHPTWQWIFGILVTVLGSILGYFAWQVHELGKDTRDINRTHAELNQEIAVMLAIMNAHITYHPNIPIEDDIDDLEDWRLEHERGHP